MSRSIEKKLAEGRKILEAARDIRKLVDVGTISDLIAEARDEERRRAIAICRRIGTRGERADALMREAAAAIRSEAERGEAGK